MRGRLFTIVGPSGAGKDTLLSGAAAHCPDLVVVRRTITRPPEAGGEDFASTTAADFAALRAAGAFALDWQAHGLSYGIPATELTPLDRGCDVIFNGSRAALQRAATLFPGLIVLLVTAPAEILAKRLAARGRESGTDIAARLDRAAYDLPPGMARIEVVNDGTPAQGIARLLAALQPVRG